jgi:hypothetical protein
LKSANTNKQGGDAAGESELKKSVSTGRECVFVPGDLARFPGGAATIQVTRYKTGEKLQGHELFGGSLRSEVISKDIPLTISP